MTVSVLIVLLTELLLYFYPRLSLQMAQSGTRGLHQQQQAGDPDKQLYCKGTPIENEG